MLLNKKWIVRIGFVLACLSILTLLRLGWLALFYPVDSTKAINGEFQLHTDFLHDNELLYLEGDWTVGEEESDQSTIKLRVQLDDSFTEELMLYIPKSPYRTTVFIDGREVGGATQHLKDSYSAYTIPFYMEKDYFLLEIKAEEEQISDSFFHYAVMLGQSEDVLTRLDISVFTRILIVFTLFLNIVYSLFIYLFVKRNKIILFYSIGYFFFFCDEIYAIVQEYVPSLIIGFDLELKLPSIFSFLTALCLTAIGRNFVPSVKMKLMKYIYLSYCLLGALIFVVPLEWYSTYATVLIVQHAISVLYTFSFVLKYKKLSSREISFLLFAFSSALSGLLWGSIKMEFYFEIPTYPVDYLCIQMSLLALLSYRYIAKNRKINQLAINLQRANEQKEEFLQTSSEKLYNPLNSMIILIDELLKVNPDEQNVQKMKHISQGMQFTLQDVLDYTKLKDGEMKSEIEPVDLQAVLYYVKNLLYYMFQSSHIHVVVELPTEPVTVMSNNKTLSQIIFNLLQYAFTSTREGSVTVRVTATHHHVQLEISDPSANYIEQDERMELGLYVSQQLIELQGGQFEVHPTSFILTFNAAMDKDAVRYEQQEILIQSSDVTEARILIIAERIEDVQLLQTLFTNEPYFIHFIRSTDEININLRKNQWDLIIIDSILSSRSGYELIGQIRKQYTLVELPILYMTVKANHVDTANCFAKGANDFITKPIEPLELKSRVNALLMMKTRVEQHLQLEAALMQAQIQPHFLFNTLNSIASLSDIDSEKMIRLLNEFGEYLHSSFNKRMMNRLVLLSDEIQVVKSYVYIEEQRFEPLLKVNWKIEEEFAISIPPFALQTIVENAIRHGLQKKRAGGEVTIHIFEEGQGVSIIVQDNGIGMSEQQLNTILQMSERQGIGLINTHERLKRCFGTGLQIDSKEGVGATVKMHIPY